MVGDHDPQHHQGAVHLAYLDGSVSKFVVDDTLTCYGETKAHGSPPEGERHWDNASYQSTTAPWSVLREEIDGTRKHH